MAGVLALAKEGDIALPLIVHTMSSAHLGETITHGQGRLQGMFQGEHAIIAETRSLRHEAPVAPHIHDRLHEPIEA